MSPPGAEAVRVLVVEDNPDSLELLVRRLSRRGFAVDSATDGLAALDAVAARRPDVVLMDLSLPVMDGWEAARRLKADPATATIPVIALTAHAMAGERERALAAGCDAFRTKPVDLEGLVRDIQRLLGSGPGGPPAR